VFNCVVLCLIVLFCVLTVLFYVFNCVVLCLIVLFCVLTMLFCVLNCVVLCLSVLFCVFNTQSTKISLVRTRTSHAGQQHGKKVYEWSPGCRVSSRGRLETRHPSHSYGNRRLRLQFVRAPDDGHNDARNMLSDVCMTK
jgi:hypothetical protein